MRFFHRILIHYLSLCSSRPAGYHKKGDLTCLNSIGFLCSDFHRLLLQSLVETLETKYLHILTQNIIVQKKKRKKNPNKTKKSTPSPPKNHHQQINNNKAKQN